MEISSPTQKAASLSACNANMPAITSLPTKADVSQPSNFSTLQAASRLPLPKYKVGLSQSRRFMLRLSCGVVGITIKKLVEKQASITPKETRELCEATANAGTTLHQSNAMCDCCCNTNMLAVVHRLSLTSLSLLPMSPVPGVIVSSCRSQPEHFDESNCGSCISFTFQYKAMPTDLGPLTFPEIQS